MQNRRSLKEAFDYYLNSQNNAVGQLQRICFHVAVIFPNPTKNFHWILSLILDLKKVRVTSFL